MKKIKIITKKISTIIFRFINEFNKVSRTYHIGILSSAVTFYIIIVLIPLVYLLNIIFIRFNIDFSFEFLQTFFNSSINNITKSNNISMSLIFIFSLIFTSSELINSLNLTSDMIYIKVPKRSYYKLRIFSIFVFTLIITILVVLGVTSNFITKFGYYLLNKLNSESVKTILIIIIPFFELLFKFAIIWIICSIVYKLVIPVKIKIIKTIKISLIITLIWYIITFFYFKINELIPLNNEMLYGTFTSTITFIYYLYLLAYVFILGIILLYYFMNKQIKKL